MTTPIDLRDDRTPKSDELIVGDVRLVVHVSGETKSLRVRDPNGALAKGSSASAGSRSTCSTASSAASSRTRSRRHQGPEHVRRARRVQERRGRRVQPERANAPPAAVHDAAETLLFRVPGCVERRGNLRSRALPVCRPARRWDDRAGLQPGVQPAVRVQSLHDVPHPVRENRLPIKILAGEKDYPVHVPSAARRRADYSRPATSLRMRESIEWRSRHAIHQDPDIDGSEARGSRAGCRCERGVATCTAEVAGKQNGAEYLTSVGINSTSRQIASRSPMPRARFCG